jgi:hypothetical protein
MEAVPDVALEESKAMMLIKEHRNMVKPQNTF